MRSIAHGQRKRGVDGPAARKYSGKYHHSRDQRKWAPCGAAPSRRGGATGSQCGMHALRLTRKNQAWIAARAARASRDVVSRNCRRHDSARRQHRKNLLAVRGIRPSAQARRIRWPVLVFFTLLGPFHMLLPWYKPL